MTNCFSHPSFEKIFEILLIFLYTGLITHENLQEYCFGLFWLSHKFEVRKLKDFCLKILKFQVTTDKLIDGDIINHARRENFCEVKVICSEVLAENLTTLLSKEFPFHKVGKTILLLMFHKLALIKGSIHASDFPLYNQVEEEDEEIEDF
jgi:hypothetical protein